MLRDVRSLITKICSRIIACLEVRVEIADVQNKIEVEMCQKSWL